MRKIIGFIFIGLNLIASQSKAQINDTNGIDFKLVENTPFQSILEEAKEQNEIIFIDFFAEWCGPCKLMEANVFNQEVVGEKYNDTFINYKVDIELKEGSAIANKYNVRSYPTYLFLHPDGQVLYRLEGVFTVDGIQEEADFALSFRD